METYQESVRSVDAALRRLNATLASYNLPGRQGTAATTTSNATPAAVAPAASAPAQKVPKQAEPVAAKPDDPAELSSSPTESMEFRARNEMQYMKDLAWQDILKLRSHQQITEIEGGDFLDVIDSLCEVLTLQRENPYCMPLYILFAGKYLQLGYPDLAAGEAYKALLLCDAVTDDSDEHHPEAFEALRELIGQIPLEERIALLKTELGASLKNEGHDRTGDEADVELDVWIREHYLPLIYRMITRSLWLCGCLRSGADFAARGLTLYPGDYELEAFKDNIQGAAMRHFGYDYIEDLEQSEHAHPSTWPEVGRVRREEYVWNAYEEDRLQPSSARMMNELMSKVAPKLEIRHVELPSLTDDPADTVTQLGVFAKEDIAPGEIILDETTLLTANNKLQDAMCDACSCDLPELGTDPNSTTLQCEDCEVIFCGEECYNAAMDFYHPALCDRDVEAIAKDVPPAEAADSLYSLLLLRVLAMAETSDVHPLEVPSVRFIWGDFHTLSPIAEHFQGYDMMNPDSHGIPRNLPFTFEHNIRLPFHMLEKMDIDFYRDPRYAVWVFNTLYAKFRGTASARLSGAGGGRIRGPEVSAVHPMWCMANHACDPNVSWEWGASIKFWAREERADWEDEKAGTKGPKQKAGIKKGEEILNHYCDIRLPVQERREWACGALGGDCMCERCVWEAQRAKKE